MDDGSTQGLQHVEASALLEAYGGFLRQRVWPFLRHEQRAPELLRDHALLLGELMHLYMYIYVCIYLHVYLFISISVSVYHTFRLSIYLSIYIYIYICIPMYVYIYMYLYLYLYLYMIPSDSVRVWPFLRHEQRAPELLRDHALMLGELIH